jgi:glycosyltransferase involved in cell wall biosynthesis
VTSRRYDLVLVHRESLPVGPPWVERILGSAGVPYVFDFDDAIYLRASSDANRRLAWLKYPSKTATVVRNARVVIAGNEHLANWARRSAADVVVIPTAIDTDVYRPAPPRMGPLCVGWSGSPSTIQHLEQLAPVLSELQRERGVRLRIIGDSGYTIDGAAVDAVPWREASELEDLRAIDIGVMPLPNDEWARGKCGLKALQYMALGIPAILSPVGVNRAIARDGAALLASTAAEWRSALRALLDDEQLRVRTGRAGRVRVESEYSLDTALPLWERALRSAADGPQS